MVNTRKSISFLFATILSIAPIALAGQSSSHKKFKVKASHISTDKSYYSENFLTGRFTSWGIDPSYTKGSINLKDSWKYFKKNKNVVVAVIDTGIQFDHPFLKNNLYIPKGDIRNSNYGIDFSKTTPSTRPIDQHGHGTHVSGIIKSIFPEVKIMALKYYNPQASGQVNLNSTIKALRYAVDQNVDIINYSGGGPEPSAEELSILRRAESKGILIVAAAGNEKSNIDDSKNAYYPASYGLSNIITVGAHDEYNNLIASSNWGTKSVDIAAPGSRIKSAIPGNGAGYMTGTSQATAFVTGVVAMLKSQYPDLNYQQLRNIVLSSSKRVPELKGKVLGSGKLDAAQASKIAQIVHSKLYKKGRTVAKNNQ